MDSKRDIRKAYRRRGIEAAARRIWDRTNMGEPVDESEVTLEIVDYLNKWLDEEPDNIYDGYFPWE